MTPAPEPAAIVIRDSDGSCRADCGETAKSALPQPASAGGKEE